MKKYVRLLSLMGASAIVVAIVVLVLNGRGRENSSAPPAPRHVESATKNPLQNTLLAKKQRAPAQTPQSTPRSGPSATTTTPVQDEESKGNEFVRQILGNTPRALEPWNVPTLGDAAVNQLISRYHELEKLSDKRMIICALGASKNPNAAQFIQHEILEVSRTKFSTEELPYFLAYFEALGYAAKTHEDSYNFLKTAGSHTPFWVGIANGDSLFEESYRNYSIIGLGITKRPEARDDLIQLAKSFGQEERQRFGHAIVSAIYKWERPESETLMNDDTVEKYLSWRKSDGKKWLAWKNTGQTDAFAAP